MSGMLPFVSFFSFQLPNVGKIRVHSLRLLCLSIEAANELQNLLSALL